MLAPHPRIAAKKYVVHQGYTLLGLVFNYHKVWQSSQCKTASRTKPQLARALRNEYYR